MCQSQRREVASKHAFSLHQAVCFRFSHEHSAGRVGRYLITGHEITSPGCVSVRRKNGNGNLSHRLAGIPLSFHIRRSRELMMPGNPHRGARRKRQRGKVPSKLPAFLTALPVSIVFTDSLCSNRLSGEDRLQLLHVKFFLAFLSIQTLTWLNCSSTARVQTARFPVQTFRKQSRQVICNRTQSLPFCSQGDAVLCV